MNPVQIGQTTHKRQEDEDEDRAEPNHVVEHAPEGDKQRSELLVGRQEMGDTGKTEHAGEGEKYVSQLVHI